MSVSSSDYILPEKFRVLSGSALKVLAMCIMLIDHFSIAIKNVYPPFSEPLFYYGYTGYSLYRIFRDIGRMAFPIFCFLLVEGYLHTRNRWKYGRNLFLFALISEIPWNFLHEDTWRYEKQNVFFTLFLGYLAFCLIDYFEKNAMMQLVCVLALLCAAYYLKADYGWKGYIFLLILFWFRQNKPAQVVIGSCWLHYEWKACFSFLPICMYNGKRGFIKGKASKYFFYAFYPLHITLLVILRRLLF